MKIHIVLGDITGFNGDAIVNAANPTLMGGGGVDGAIHRVAGVRLQKFCQLLPVIDPGMFFGVRCLPGQVRATPAFNLACKWVFHTVGPIFDLQRGGELHPGEVRTQSRIGAQLDLARCFINCGYMMQAMGLTSIAFPAISTGIYGCPHEICAQVAHNWTQGAPLPFDVTFYLMPEGYSSIWLKEFGQETAFGVEPS